MHVCSITFGQENAVMRTKIFIVFESSVIKYKPNIQEYCIIYIFSVFIQYLPAFSAQSRCRRHPFLVLFITITTLELLSSHEYKSYKYTKVHIM